MPLPYVFCWSRFGTEAGEPIEEILSRKERERQANGGVFLWGIGNALAPSMRYFLALESKPELLLSPIKSPPRQRDVSPAKVVRWTAGRTMEGAQYVLPSGSVVTSGVGADSERKRHYALVCASHECLLPRSLGTVAMDDLSNLLTGNPVGASQVTAVVKRSRTKSSVNSYDYPVALRVDLVAPYFVELTEINGSRRRVRDVRTSRQGGQWEPELPL